MSTAAQSWPRIYWRQSRSHRYSLLFALPLLVAYEAMAAILGHGEAQAIRNGADVLLKTEMGAGHGGPSGRYDAWKEEAFIVAWILDRVQDPTHR